MIGPAHLVRSPRKDLALLRRARAAWGGMIRTMRLIADAVGFAGFADAAAGAEIVEDLRK